MIQRMIKTLLFTIIVLCCAGCGNQNENNISPTTEDNILKYETTNMTAYAVNDEGVLYISGFTEIVPENSTSIDEHEDDDEGVLSESEHIHTLPKTSVAYLHKYDSDGNLVSTHDFDDLGASTFQGMTADGDDIYFTISSYNEKGICIVLYSYNTTTDHLERLYDFNEFENAQQLVFVDDRIYILGYSTYSMNLSSMPQGAYQSKGEKLIYYSLSEKNVSEIGINIPITISRDEDKTLAIYAYLENEGYCLLKYDPQKDSVIVTANFSEAKFIKFALCGNGKKIIYTKNINSRGLLMSEVSALDVESELYLDASPFNFHEMYYTNGYIYCTDNKNDIVRIPYNEEKQNNRVIRYIQPGYQSSAPFGCGYLMDRKEMDDQKFAVKVLAQDKDYDICLVDTKSYVSYNLKENGAFYSLNEIEGIQEYLDLCFPYVKEAAVNKNGSIWMLPIAVDIPGFLVNEDMLTQEQIHLTNSMTYDEFFKMQNEMKKELHEKISVNLHVLSSSFFLQYFASSHDLHNDAFKNTMKLFQKHSKSFPQFVGQHYIETDDFLFDYVRYTFEYENALKKASPSFNVYNMPKLDPTEKNVGTCIFLSVNPNSSNLNETLQYLADLIRYTMEMDEKPLFFQQPGIERSKIQQAIYDLYENGEITYQMDADIYFNDFFDMVNQESSIDDYINETQRKLDAYVNE